MLVGPLLAPRTLKIVSKRAADGLPTFGMQAQVRSSLMLTLTVECVAEDAAQDCVTAILAKAHGIYPQTDPQVALQTCQQLHN